MLTAHDHSATAQPARTEPLADERPREQQPSRFFTLSEAHAALKRRQHASTEGR